MLTCKETGELLSLSRDHRLSWSERWGVRMHLWLCDQCRRFERQLAWLASLGRALEEDPGRVLAPAADLSDEARQRIRTAMQAGGDAPGPHEGHPHPPGG